MIWGTEQVTMHRAPLIFVIMCAIKMGWAISDHPVTEGYEIQVGVSNAVELLHVFSEEVFFLGSYETVESCIQACTNYNESGKTCASFSFHGNLSSELDTSPCFARTDKGWAPQALEGAVSGRLGSSHEQGPEQCMEAKAETQQNQPIFNYSNEQSQDAHAHQRRIEHGSESGAHDHARGAAEKRPVLPCKVLEWRLFRMFELGADTKMIMSAR
jgi:hypothetical protein